MGITHGTSETQGKEEEGISRKDIAPMWKVDFLGVITHSNLGRKDITIYGM